MCSYVFLQNQKWKRNRPGQSEKGLRSGFMPKTQRFENIHFMSKIYPF
jgi:hypothetical protein